MTPASPESGGSGGSGGSVDDRVRDFIAATLPQWPVTAGAVALLDASGEVRSWGFGAEGTPAATADQLFQVGSITKSFVGVVTLACVERELLSLDDDIRALAPWVDLGPGARPTTVRDLLTHTTGLVLGGDGVPDDLAQLWALRDLVRSDDPAAHFHYSNVGYMLLGHALQAVSGRSFDDLVRDVVFEPLGMTHSRGRIGPFEPGVMAAGTWPQRPDTPWVPGDSVVAAPWLPTTATDGCVLASAHDLMKFARLLLSDGEVDGVRILSPESMGLLTTPSAPGGEDVVDLRGIPAVTSSRYGLGVNVEMIGGHECVTHGGGMVGFQSFLLVDRTAGVAAVVLTNANGCYPVAQVIARVAHAGLVAPDRSLSPRDIVVAVPSMEARFTGRFTNRVGDVIEVSDEVSVAAGGITGRLWPLWSGRWATDHPALREFHWDISDEGWTYGPHVFTSSTSVDAAVVHDAVDVMSGTYRSHTPWYPLLRVYARAGVLYLAAPGGVEAPDSEVMLMPVADGVWRIGSDAWLPERLVRGPVVAGRVISVLRDGVQYSRSD